MLETQNISVSPCIYVILNFATKQLNLTNRHSSPGSVQDALLLCLKVVNSKIIMWVYRLVRTSCS